MTDKNKPLEFDLMRAAINSELEKQMVIFGFDKNTHKVAFKHFTGSPAQTVLSYGISNDEINARINLLKSKQSELPKIDSSSITKDVGEVIGEAYEKTYPKVTIAPESMAIVPDLLKTEAILKNTLNRIAYRAGIDFLAKQRGYPGRTSER
jgi:hypothetical protein